MQVLDWLKHFTDLHQHFFTERVINLWNSLDKENCKSYTRMGHFQGYSSLYDPRAASQISGETLTGKIPITTLTLENSFDRRTDRQQPVALRFAL